jgi:alkylation response protein AidB-like acyl-CoA dehydrogenase
MDLLPSAEQIEIVDSSAAFVAARISMPRTRELFEAGIVPAIDATAWMAAAELGWLALGLPADLGGVGAGLVDEALLLREIGRGLAPGPFIATILAARVAAFGGRADLAEEIAAGRQIGLVIPMSADAVAGDGTLRVDELHVDATSGLALVATSSVAALVEVGALDHVESVPCLDPTALLQRATSAGTPPLVAVTAAVDQVERRGQVLVAAMLCGLAEWARDTGSRHAIDRVQFDKPIGVHQAIKHPCADMAVQAQLAYAQVLFAALATDEARPDAELQALSARSTAAAAAEFSTAATLQILGGMGFTHEHDVHLYVKRALLLAHAFGDTAGALRRVLTLPEPV